MKSKKGKKISESKLTKAIFKRFLITMSIYTAVLAIGFFVTEFVLTRFIWYKDDLLYGIFHAIEVNSKWLLTVCWLCGFSIIFFVHWRKTLGYVDVIAAASDELVSQDEEIIRLPIELKHVEDQLNSAKQEAMRNARLAKKAEQRKNDLIVYLAHDLKTPLTSVIGYLMLLRDEPQISEELRQKYVSVSLDKAERLESLINEFFEITRFSMGKLVPEIEKVNLSRMMEQIIYEFKPMLSAKNLQCSLETLPDIEIKCDINKMERVFDNLIRNAISYSFEDSTIEIIMTQKEKEVVIQFKNQGNTIPKEKLSSIFEQFYRLDISRGSETGGAGLGLAIAKEIIELHNGSIKADSENEKNEFTVRMPNGM